MLLSVRPSARPDLGRLSPGSRGCWLQRKDRNGDGCGLSERVLRDSQCNDQK